MVLLLCGIRISLLCLHICLTALVLYNQFSLSIKNPTTFSGIILNQIQLHGLLNKSKKKNLYQLYCSTSMPNFSILLKRMDITQLMASGVWGWFPWFKLTALRRWAVSTFSIFSGAISAPEVPVLPTGSRGPTGCSLPCFQQPGAGWWLR
jgi:hypothetical protein